MIILMATQNDYNMMWMNPNDMMMGEAVGVNSSSDIMSLSHSSQMDNSYYSMPIPPPFESTPQPPLELDGFLMEDMGEYEEPPQFMAAATQTQTNLRRKIKPVKHPGLKLQTPIAFKSDTDPDVIPIQKDGMAICVKCRAMGVKHAFYTRNRNYCSLKCARGFDEAQMRKEEKYDEFSDIRFKNPYNGTIKAEEVITKQIVKLECPIDGPVTFNANSQIATFPFPKIDLMEKTVPEPVHGTKLNYELSQSFDWKPKLNQSHFSSVPVNLLKHAPMADCWEDITVGMKVEVENAEASSGPDSFWVASVLKVHGYMALLRYDGYDDKHDFWVNLCNSNVHAVGWCAMRGKPLIPPRDIAESSRDWKNFLVRSLTGARTLPMNFSFKVVESLRSRFRIGMQLEVLDKAKIGHMCVATIKRIVGKRLNLIYYNSPHVDSGFWCHEDSPLIHPVGWSLRVGHILDASLSYLNSCESGVIDKDGATEELFTAPFQCVSDWNQDNQDTFETGMKLEAIDPLNLSAISAATVMKVLQDGYILIRIDSYPEDGDGSDWFCYHSRSPNIFPAGFCQKNNLHLVPPISYQQSADFSWEVMVQDTGCILASPSLFQREEIEHGLSVGMSLECADLMDPRLVCVASISQVVGRLLKLHFDGWEVDYDQYMDCCSPDIYPVGWCHLASHKLEAPKHQLNPGETAEKKKKKNLGRKNKKKPNVKSTSISVKNNVQRSNEESSTPVIISSKSEVEMINSQPDDSTLSSSNDNSQDNTHESSSQIETPHEMDVDIVTAPVSPPRGTSTYIPRLVDGAKDGNLNPSEWTSADLATFLTKNDCGVYANNFLIKQITGAQFLAMKEDEMVEVASKTGPGLKIYSLLQQLLRQLGLKASKFARR